MTFSAYSRISSFSASISAARCACKEGGDDDLRLGLRLGLRLCPLQGVVDDAGRRKSAAVGRQLQERACLDGSDRRRGERALVNAAVGCAVHQRATIKHVGSSVRGGRRGGKGRASHSSGRLVTAVGMWKSRLA
eukprot:808207-Pleurochrysis_carterae.AAC.1